MYFFIFTLIIFYATLLFGQSINACVCFKEVSINYKVLIKKVIVFPVTDFVSTIVSSPLTIA